MDSTGGKWQTAGEAAALFCGGRGGQIGLLRLSNETNFVDKKSFGLRSACWDSLKNMASVHYDEVKTVLTKEKSEASGNHLLSCIDLLQQIDEINQHNIDKGISFELALALTTN